MDCRIFSRPIFSTFPSPESSITDKQAHGNSICLVLSLLPSCPTQEVYFVYLTNIYINFLVCASPCSKCITQTSSFNPHNNIHPTNVETKREKLSGLYKVLSWVAEPGWDWQLGLESVLDSTLPGLSSLWDAYWFAWGPLKLLQGQSTHYSSIPSISEAVVFLQHGFQ